ncbi:hypothetical protein PGT21_028229 [Puccinia graminis f. sp. tritici]|uniref:Uncharacterized protein n=1 Tax=Puccinia graminis f. sp. tritici TaxID=56615 RepID=A0A5B0S432_PUCGR|nr:hypothetical protein PGT21_028229 [Puccinia graminis f. sp. tritici]KAA1131685.1 hypothetical protein PGTUg99_006348 [Puccinia graminis f. sp. tritici]KAA1132542.1 hypothetical protein PGTUg99_015430 [Puccinia graminis f. sp. tritici]
MCFIGMKLVIALNLLLSVSTKNWHAADCESADITWQVDSSTGLVKIICKECHQHDKGFQINSLHNSQECKSPVISGSEQRVCFVCENSIKHGYQTLNFNCHHPQKQYKLPRLQCPKCNAHPPAIALEFHS